MSEPRDQDEIPESFFRLGDSPELSTRVKGSRFTGQVLSATSFERALQRLQTIRKQHHDATHHCWAAVWGNPECVEQRFDDDGEPSGSAGRPILHHLLGSGAGDAIVVVTRWFGGTKLGTGGLVQAYSGAASLALAEAGRIRVERRIPLSLDFGYDDLGGVEAILARREAWTRQVTRHFEPGPRFLVHARRNRAEALRAELFEGLAGRIGIQAGAELFVES